jgi:hypothetical protein
MVATLFAPSSFAGSKPPRLAMMRLGVDQSRISGSECLNAIGDPAALLLGMRMSVSGSKVGLDMECTLGSGQVGW